MLETAILKFQCPDQAGIIATISNWAFKHGANIIRSDQYSTDPEGGEFFLRLEICFDSNKLQCAQLTQEFQAIAEKFSGTAKIQNKKDKKRFAVLVSKQDHCLYDILYHAHANELPGEISMIISNHPDCEALAARHNIPYHYLPVNKETKPEQEKQILELINQDSEFLVLARYMQILSSDFLAGYQHDIINIHHSFLPSFIGADPYRQAYERGVKLIGATAHYVTADLDEGPIIEQQVERISHHDSIIDLRRKGKHVEKVTLMKAVMAQLEDRVIRFGNKTVVFD